MGYGSTCFNVQSPAVFVEPTGVQHAVRAHQRGVRPSRGVALQVAFERQTLKPVFFYLIGYRLWV
jgi:hypothetical protein